MKSANFTRAERLKPMFLPLILFALLGRYLATGIRQLDRGRFSFMPT
jgi:hypothetical protein